MSNLKLSTISKSFFVPDIIPLKLDELKIIFLLESPYLEEVKAGCPLAGSSGKSVSKFLHQIDKKIPIDLPFGIYLKKSEDSRFAIMNASNYPMDLNAYPLENQLKGVVYNTKHLDELRIKIPRNSIKKLPAEVLNTFSRSLLDLKKRVRSILILDQLIVPCGKVAASFWNHMQLECLNEVICLPHPSRNQWSQKQYTDLMNEFKTKINNIITQ